METLAKKNENSQKRKDWSRSSGSSTESRESSCCRSSSETSSEEVKAKGSSSPPLLGWPIHKAQVSKSSVPDVGEAEKKEPHLEDSKFKKISSKNSGLLCLVF
jgi:hypothetical protein